MCLIMLHIQGNDLFRRDAGIRNSLLSFVKHSEERTLYAHGSLSIRCMFALRGLTFFLLCVSIFAEIFMLYKNVESDARYPTEKGGIKRAQDGF